MRHLCHAAAIQSGRLADTGAALDVPHVPITPTSHRHYLLRAADDVYTFATTIPLPVASRIQRKFTNELIDVIKRDAIKTVGTEATSCLPVTTLGNLGGGRRADAERQLFPYNIILALRGVRSRGTYYSVRPRRPPLMLTGTLAPSLASG
ncbi:unnamed protein product, partial [Iphiclides podalirius]